MCEWRGLHNRHRHSQLGEKVAWCVDCPDYCYPSEPCRCCLAAEVERLTAALADRDRRIAAALALHVKGEQEDIDYSLDRVIGYIDICESVCGGLWPCATIRALRGDA